MILPNPNFMVLKVTETSHIYILHICAHLELCKPTIKKLIHACMAACGWVLYIFLGNLENFPETFLQLILVPHSLHPYLLIFQIHPFVFLFSTPQYLQHLASVQELTYLQ